VSLGNNEIIGPGIKPIVGREKELGLLRTQLDHVEKGKGARVVLISGEAGIGKTRLAREFVNNAIERGVKVLEGKCLYKNLAPYLPIFEALRGANLEHLISFMTPPRVDCVILMNSAGVPLGWLERSKGNLDMIIFSGMLSAVSSFVKESMNKFGKGEIDKSVLNVMGYGDHRILIESNRVGILVVILTGQETEIFKDEMVSILEKIDSKYGELLIEWDGDTSKVEPIKALLESLLCKYDGIDYATMPRDKQWRIFENISKGLQRISREKPILLFLDDLQWADASSLALLQEVLRSCEDNPLLILGTYRTEEIEDIDGEEHPLLSFRRAFEKKKVITEINLEQLDEETTISLLLHEIGGLANDPLGNLVARESEGNPFFTLEVVNLLKDEKIIIWQNGQWIATCPLEKIGIPKKVRDVVFARLSRLPKQERDILECAAVIGEVFRTEIISNVLEMSPLQTLKALKEIEQRYKIIYKTPMKGKYTFDHAKIREVLYSELSDDLKREYHKTIAECLERIFNEGKAEVLSDLAVHAYLANHPKADSFCKKAGDAARSVFNNDEARRFYNMALKICSDEKRPDLYDALGEVEYQCGRFEEAGSWFDMVVISSSDNSERVNAIAKRGRSLDRQGRYQEGLDVLEKEPPNQQTEPLIAAQWYSTRGWLRFRMMDFDGAEADTKKALMDFDARGGLANDIVDCWNTLGAIESSRGRLEEAAANFRKGLVIAEEKGAHFHGIRIMSNLSLCEGSLGHFDKALELAERCLVAAERTGNQLFIPMSLFRKGLFHMYLGDYEEAYETLTRTIDMFAKAETIAFVTEALRRRGMCLIEMSKFEQAERDVREALQLAGGLKESLLIMVNLSEVLLALGNTKEAEVLAQRGVEGLRKTGARAWMGMALRNLALVFVGQNRREEAESTFREAYEEYGGFIDAWEYAQGLRWWGEAMASWDVRESAREKLEEARKRFKEMGAKGELAKVEKDLQNLENKES